MRAHSGTKVLRVGGRRLLATYHRPAGPERRRFPAVLFLHGFPGSEKSVDVQRALLARGAASVSLHFAGAWGSEGVYRFTTLPAQARAALRLMRRFDFVDPERIAVYGFSMGGWAALNLAALEPGLKAVVAVAPVGGPEMANARTRAHLKRLSRPLRTPPVEELLRDFRRAVTELDPAFAVSRFRAPLLLVHGDQDDVVPLPVSLRLARLAGRRARLVIERGGAHDFLDRRERLARKVSGWLMLRL